MKYVQLLSVVVTSMFICSCAAKQITAGAERTLVTRTAAPKGCKFKGTVIGEQGGALTGGWTSNKALAEGAMNDMKNNAHALGANYVVLEVNSAGTTHSGNSWGFSGQQTDSTYTGNAFSCPPDLIGAE